MQLRKNTLQPQISIIGLQTWISRNGGKIGLQDRLKFIFLKRALYIISCSNAIKKKYAPTSDLNYWITDVDIKERGKNRSAGQIKIYFFEKSPIYNIL